MNGSPRISGNVSVWSFDAAKAIIHERIAHMKPEDVCTVSIIESRFSSEMEDEKKEEIRHGMERVLSWCMKSSNLLARMNDDMLLVVDFNPESTERIHANMLDIHGKLEKVVRSVQDADIYVSIGTAFACGTLLTFAPLLEQAHAALNDARTAEDGCVIMEFPIEVHVNDVIARLNDWIALYKVTKNVQLVYVSSGFYHTLKKNVGSCSFDGMSDIIIHQYDIERHNKAVIACFNKNIASESIFRFSVKGGNWRWCRSQIIPINRPRENGAYVLALSSDITEEMKSTWS